MNVRENVAVALQVESLCLRTGEGLLVSTVEVVLERNVFGAEVVAENVNGGVAWFVAASALAGVVDDDGLAGVWIDAFKGDVGLVDDQLLAVGAGSDKDKATSGRDPVDGGLDRVVITSAIGSDVKDVVGCWDEFRGDGSGVIFWKGWKFSGAVIWSSRTWTVLFERDTRAKGSGRRKIAHTHIEGDVLGLEVFRFKVIDCDVLKSNI
jgi:hypothetical protein